MLTFKNNSLDPFYNQAFEEFVFQNFLEDDIFFLWQNSPAVIVGSYQNICREVSVPALLKLGIPVIRRMSGGGTVYHDMGNVNYTYITAQPQMIDYDLCLKPVIDALNAMGIPAHKNRTCDIAIGENKISGSAQRASKGRVLHHGTLLFDSDLAVLDKVTTHHKNDCFQSKGTLSAICTVTNIKEHLAAPMTIERFKEQLMDHVLTPKSACIELTPEMESEVLRLRDEKYRSWEWTWGKTPAFSYERSGVFAGVPITVSYSAKHGIVSSPIIECSAIDGQKAAQMLDGARLDPVVFSDICRSLAGDFADELLGWLL